MQVSKRADSWSFSLALSLFRFFSPHDLSPNTLSHNLCQWMLMLTPSHSIDDSDTLFIDIDAGILCDCSLVLSRCWCHCCPWSTLMLMSVSVYLSLALFSLRPSPSSSPSFSPLSSLSPLVFLLKLEPMLGFLPLHPLLPIICLWHTLAWYSTYVLYRTGYYLVQASVLVQQTLNNIDLLF